MNISNERLETLAIYLRHGHAIIVTEPELEAIETRLEDLTGDSTNDLATARYKDDHSKFVAWTGDNEPDMMEGTKGVVVYADGITI